MSKIPSKHVGKNPWIPPPGRTTQKKKPLQTSFVAASKTLPEADLTKEDSNLTFTLSSMASICGVDICPPHGMFPALKQELRMLRLHCASLKTSSQHLHRAVDVSNPHVDITKELVKKIDEYVLEFDTAFEELENTVTLLENTVARKAAAQEVYIEDQARKISFLQGKMNAMESMKTALEASKNNLQKQLSHKESQIKFLSEELSKTNGGYSGGKNDHEALIKIIEELKSNARLEKETLKKSIKVQKTRAKVAEESICEIQKELKEKVQYLYDIACERDQWKIQLTVAKNSLIEQRNEMEELKKQNVRLQDQLNDMESRSKTDTGNLEETQQLIEKLKTENQVLKEDNDKLSQQVEASTTEMREINEKLEKTANDHDKPPTLSQSEDHYCIKESLKEMKNLVAVLQSTKEMFSSLKIQKSSNEDFSSGESMHKATNENAIHNNIAHMVQETKDYLIEIKKLYNLFVNTHQDSSNPEKKFQELEILYNQVVNENRKLQEEINLMKNNLSKSSLVTPSNYHEKLNTFPGVDPTKKLWSDLKDKNEEFQLLRESHQQKEKEHMSEMQLLREKYFKQEAVHEMKIRSLEDELRTKKTEFSRIEHVKNEEEERLKRKIRDLQESLDHTTASYESLQKYVQILKSSYLNVFGTA